jgi:hypothetical protein
MKSYPPSVSPVPTLTDEATLDAALEHVLTTIPLETQGIYSPQTIYSVLLWAASRHDTIEHTCQVLEGVPSSNDIRFHLNKLDDLEGLENQVNAALQGRIPERIANHRHRLAIDLHLIPYYGAAEETVRPYLYRSQAKAGTTTFFAYATVYVIRCHQRVTLAIHAIPRGETLVATLTYLLARLTPIRVKVERLYLDRGFYSVPVIRWLQALRIPFIMPAIMRGKRAGTRALCQGRCSYQTLYTLKSQDYGIVTCQMAVVCRYRKGTCRQHGIQYLLFVVYRVKVAPQQLPLHYRARFGIETSYRLKNACRIRTTTRHPVVRLLFVALAFILVNLWVWLLWTRLSLTRRGGRRVYQEYFRLKTMLEFLRHAIERRFPLIHVVAIPASG